MDDIRVDQALAEVTSALHQHHDVTGFLADLIEVCQRALAVDATGIMVLSRSGRLQLLAASTHRSTELELYQSQIDEGPCVDAAADDVSVILAEEAALRERWPRFGPAMVEAGFRSVHSMPLRWEGAPLGAMALFRHRAVALDGREDQAARAFADVVVHAVMDDELPGSSATQDRIDAALAGRVLIEQAKGVMARHRGVGMGDAYDLLIERATASGRTLTEAAAELVAQAQRGELDPA
ncbi:GAF and ANTAR domain-containing protein [Aeromicrobium wangtongii]|uniref:GAF and ANTAR domain-containing protein n=1 Tax=Aeromicrobium wangtongii TaxID=2969247 RepID=UPI0020172099|nr:GAF and ANTAR domain-containing protein [Aeromicrobium wangtongii]MCL3818832.1 GAF and ANTAR domain-containing protein [Aeromicrobium wangtongii]